MAKASCIVVSSRERPARVRAGRTSRHSAGASARARRGLLRRGGSEDRDDEQDERRSRSPRRRRGASSRTARAAAARPCSPCPMTRSRWVCSTPAKVSVTAHEDHAARHQPEAPHVEHLVVGRAAEQRRHGVGDHREIDHGVGAVEGEMAVRGRDLRAVRVVVDEESVCRKPQHAGAEEGQSPRSRATTAAPPYSGARAGLSTPS